MKNKSSHVCTSNQVKHTQVDNMGPMGTLKAPYIYLKEMEIQYHDNNGIDN